VSIDSLPTLDWAAPDLPAVALLASPAYRSQLEQYSRAHRYLTASTSQSSLLGSNAGWKLLIALPASSISIPHWLLSYLAAMLEMQSGGISKRSTPISDWRSLSALSR